MKKSTKLASAIATIFILSNWGTGESNVAGSAKQRINFYGELQTHQDPGSAIEVDNISIENVFKQIPAYVKPSIDPKNKKTITAENAIAKAAQSAEQAARAAKKAARTAKKISSKKGIDIGTEIASDAALAAQKAAEAATSAAQAIAESIPQNENIKTKEHILKDDPKTSLIQAEIDLAEVSEIQVPNPEEMWIYQKKQGYRKLEFISVSIFSNDAKKTKTDYLIEKHKKVYCDRINAAGPVEQKVPLTAIKSLKILGYKDRDLEETKRIQREEREKIKKMSKKIAD